MPERLSMTYSNIRTVLFDMDGVITSEYLYWDAAALTVCELFFGKYHFGTEAVNVPEYMDKVEQIRQMVFCGGRTIQAVKGLGVNTNWDLAYLTFCAAKIVQTEGIAVPVLFERAADYLYAQNSFVPELYERVGKAFAQRTGKVFADCRRGSGALWAEVVDTFQHWFLGSERCQKYIDGEEVRIGLNSREQPIVPLEDLHIALSALKQKGLTLGIGTGRPAEEIELPLRLWDIAQYFDREHCVTYTDVAAAEQELHLKQSIAKPHPFVFLKGLYGREISNRALTEGDYDASEIKKTLIIGDAASDLLAAQNAGFPFAAVLTGAGKREYFEENNADLILKDITELPRYL